MKKINYKGRCEKRKVSKCREICRTYSRIQSAYLDVLEKDKEVISFECNVCLVRGGIKHRIARPEIFSRDALKEVELW